VSEQQHDRHDDPYAEPAIYTLTTLPLARIAVSDANPRQRFDEIELDRLAHAIATRGFQHPVLVAPGGDDGGFVLVDGERRVRAALRAGLTEVPAVVKTREVDPADDLLDAILANDLGVRLDVVEEARGYQRLLDLGRTRKACGLPRPHAG